MSFNFSEIFKDQPKEKIYEQLYQMAEGLFYDERDMLANMGNLSSLLYFNLSNINWAGFYLYKNDELVLGPFNGKVACTRIAMGRGVCGTAAAENITQIVEDVHQFPGHIACDSASNSEIVIPLFKDEKLLGVLDIDSFEKATFDTEDEKVYKEAEKQLSSFIEKYEGKYPKAVNVIRDNPSLFSFYDYPAEIQRSLYTSNPIESFNKKYKKNIRKKEQCPNEDSLDRFTCAIASDYNKQFESRQMKGFSKCSYELQQLFEERYGSKG